MICCSILTEILSSSEENGPKIGKKSCTAKFTLNLNSTNDYQDDVGTIIANVDVTIVFYLFKN